jgi:hypothetical protein
MVNAPLCIQPNIYTHTQHPRVFRYHFRFLFLSLYHWFQVCAKNTGFANKGMKNTHTINKTKHNSKGNSSSQCFGQSRGVGVGGAGSVDKGEDKSVNVGGETGHCLTNVLNLASVFACSVPVGEQPILIDRHDVLIDTMVNPTFGFRRQ